MQSEGWFSLCAACIGAAIVAWGRVHPPGGAPAPGPRDGPEPPGDFPLHLTPGPDPVVISEKARFQHVEILGSSGTGKNYHGLLPMIHQDIHRGAGLVILDPKGAMRGPVEAYARAHGRSDELHRLDLGDPGGSGTYNPFLGDDPTLVAERVHAAFYADDATATSFYRDTALGFFYLFFSLCRSLDVLATPEQLRAVALDQGALARLAALAPRSREAQEFRALLLRQSPLDYARTMQGVVNALTPLCTGPFAPLLNSTCPSIDLGEILDRGGILYSGLASDRYPSLFKRVSTLLLMDVQSSMTRRYGSQGRPVFLYLDEFADLLYPEVRALIAKAREARVGIVLAHQSLGDLDRHGRGMAGAIFENTSNKVLLRVGSADSAAILAGLSGTRASEGERLSRAIRLGGIHGASTPRTASPLERGEPVFPPDELLSLAVGEAFMVVQRPWGRELFRGRLNAAPDLPATPGGTVAGPEAPGRARRGLDLGPLEGPEAGVLRPRGPVAEAALEHMQRSRKRAP